MKKNLIMEHNYVEILNRTFGKLGNCIKDPGERVVIFWGMLPGKTLAIFLTLPVAVFTAIIISKD